jgi:hypothetical protein
MRTAQWVYEGKLFPVGTSERAVTPCKRNLGGAILLAAISDYRSRNRRVHEHAREFLYPRTTATRNHFAWVVTLAPGVNPGWLREALDGQQAKWDRQRSRMRPRRGTR